MLYTELRWLNPPDYLISLSVPLHRIALTLTPILQAISLLQVKELIAIGASCEPAYVLEIPKHVFTIKLSNLR
jgi:hypothetical protein